MFGKWIWELRFWALGVEICEGINLFAVGKCNPLILPVRIIVSVLDTAYKVDLTFLILRLSRFQFQILFFNILNFSKFFEIFLDYFGNLRNRCRQIPIIGSTIFISQTKLNFGNLLSPCVLKSYFI